MSDYIRITVPLLKEDYRTLTDASAKEYREPRQHAAWLLRRALGIADANDQPTSEPMQNATSGHIRQDLATSSVL